MTWFLSSNYLSHKQLETRLCVMNIVAVDALVLKHQAINIDNVYQILIALDQVLK